jgi:hypothetical protein
MCLGAYLQLPLFLNGELEVKRTLRSMRPSSSHELLPSWRDPLKIVILIQLTIESKLNEVGMPSLTPSLSATSTQELLSASLSLVVFVQARAQNVCIGYRGIPGRCRSHSLFQFERRSQYYMFTSIHYSELISRWTKLTIKPIQIVQHPLLISLEQLPISKYRLKTWRSIIVPKLYIVV